ncbi:MAG: glycoside hydrolase family 2 [Clostridiales bacterium]|nr:glycoside hydrolase family 2 [Clostridiales bacterium]
MSISTRWRNMVDADNVLPEYPRPQLVRDEWINLNGVYDYVITQMGSKWPEKFTGKILVPFCIESELSGVCKPLEPGELLWYKRKFTIPESYDGKKILLHFGAVDWKAKVYVNSSLVGGHTGGYCPFTVDITACAKTGENELVVSVYDPTDEGWQQRGKQVLEPHGFWYTATSGIWQTVWLEAVDETYIKDIKITPNIDKERIHLIVDIENKCELHATIKDGDKVIFDNKITNNEFISIPEPVYWSPENPHLYDIEISVLDGNKVCDKVKSYFGMRKFSIENDEKGLPRLCLNNKPYFQRGLLDQGYWCESLLTAPTDESMIYDIQKMKDLGFNMLRKHIKIEPARWYYHCDRLGMIVWQDMVSGGEYIGTLTAGVLPLLNVKLKDNNYKRFKRGNIQARIGFNRELFEMLDYLYNFPSIGCWVPFNEGWGQFDAADIYARIKAFDSTRIVDHASGWYDQGCGDLNSVHKYILKIKPPKQPDRKRPFVLSEFGGYSRVCENHTFDENKSFGYKMFKDEKELTTAYKKLIEEQVAPLIEKGLSATVYTQVSDVEREVNGIMTYDREIVKIDEETIKEMNKKLSY